VGHAGLAEPRLYVRTGRKPKNSPAASGNTRGLPMRGPAPPVRFSRAPSSGRSGVQHRRRPPSASSGPSPHLFPLFPPGPCSLPVSRPGAPPHVTAPVTDSRRTPGNRPRPPPTRSFPPGLPTGSTSARDSAGQETAAEHEGTDRDRRQLTCSLLVSRPGAPRLVTAPVKRPPQNTREQTETAASSPVPSRSPHREHLGSSRRRSEDRRGTRGTRPRPPPTHLFPPGLPTGSTSARDNAGQETAAEHEGTDRDRRQLARSLLVSRPGVPRHVTAPVRRPPRNTREQTETAANSLVPSRSPDREHLGM
jgi:hypothetical protein